MIILMGKSGAGKDTVMQFNLGLHPCIYHEVISATTRPPRDYEIDGQDYHFISEKEFLQHIFNEEMLEASEFNGWFYGTLISTLHPTKCNLAILSPESATIVYEDPRIDSMVIYIDADDKVRLLRALNREESPDCAEICRRFQADEKDFAQSEIIPDQIIQNNLVLSKTLDLLSYPAIANFVLG